MRNENWPTALTEFIESRRTTPFAWGESDCCLFAADAVQAMTGIDFAAQRRGKYSDARGALEIIEEVGGIENLVPFEPVEPGYAQRGDVVMLERDGRNVLGVNCGNQIAGQGTDGIVFLPPNAAIKAWRTAR